MTPPLLPQGDGSLRMRLRRDTREAHERVDRAFGALDLSRRGDLAIFLQAHELAFRAVDAAFDGAGDAPPSMRDVLRRDLDALGRAVSLAAPPVLQADPLGISYVVSGAHYGARVLCRRVLASSDPQVRAAVNYLESDAMAAHWAILVARLKAKPSQGPVADGIVEGATATFALFERCLDATRGERVGEVAR